VITVAARVASGLMSLMWFSLSLWLVTTIRISHGSMII